MTDRRGPRPWELEEMAHAYSSTDGQMVPGLSGLHVTAGEHSNVVKIHQRRQGLAADAPEYPTPGKLYRLPRTRDSINALFRESSKATRDVIREIARLGYDVEEIANDYVALSGVGRGGMEIELHHDGDLPLEIRQVRFGTQTWTAREAARWLRKRAAR